MVVNKVSSGASFIKTLSAVLLPIFLGYIVQKFLKYSIYILFNLFSFPFLSFPLRHCVALLVVLPLLFSGIALALLLSSVALGCHLLLALSRCFCDFSFRKFIRSFNESDQKYLPSVLNKPISIILLNNEVAYANSMRWHPTNISSILLFSSS